MIADFARILDKLRRAVQSSYDESRLDHELCGTSTEAENPQTLFWGIRPATFRSLDDHAEGDIPTISIISKPVKPYQIGASLNVTPLLKDLAEADAVLEDMMRDVGKQIARNEAAVILKGLDENAAIAIKRDAPIVTRNEVLKIEQMIRQEGFAPDTTVVDPALALELVEKGELRPCWNMSSGADKSRHQFGFLADLDAFRINTPGNRMFVYAKREVHVAKTPISLSNNSDGGQILLTVNCLVSSSPIEGKAVGIIQ